MGEVVETGTTLDGVEATETPFRPRPAAPLGRPTFAEEEGGVTIDTGDTIDTTVDDKALAEGARPFALETLAGRPAEPIDAGPDSRERGTFRVGEVAEIPLGRFW